MKSLDGDKIKLRSVGYRQGAMVGGLVGVIAGLIFKRSVILLGVIGLVGGGYIGYKVAESTELTNEFKKI